MKRIALILSLILYTATCFAQQIIPFASNRTTDTAYSRGSLRIDNTLRLPFYSSDGTKAAVFDASGNMSLTPILSTNSLNAATLKNGDSTHYVFLNGFAPVQDKDTLNGVPTKNYNTAEGVLFPVNSGGDTLVWIGPIDTTNHEYSIVNGLYIKYSYDSGNSYTSAKLLYTTDTSAIVNVGGGQIANGKIFICFRNWNVISGGCQQMYMTSSDHVKTFTAPTSLGLSFANSCMVPFSHSVINYDDSNTYIFFYATGNVQSIKIKTDLTYTLQGTNEVGGTALNGTEPSVAYCGSNRFIMILRNDSSTFQMPYMQYSITNANINQAWTYNGPVNMHSDPFIVKYVSPDIRYCKPFDVVAIVASGRNIVNCTTCSGAKDDSVKILTGRPSVVMANPALWQQSCALQIPVPKGDLINRAYPTLARVNDYKWAGLVSGGVLPYGTVSFSGAGANIQQCQLYKFELGFTSNRTGNISSIIRGHNVANNRSGGTDIDALRPGSVYNKSTREIYNVARAYDAHTLTPNFGDAPGEIGYYDSMGHWMPLFHGNPAFGESIVWTKVGTNTYASSRPIQALNHIWIDTTVSLVNNMGFVYNQTTGKWTPTPLTLLALGHNDVNNHDTALAFTTDSLLSKTANHLFRPETGTNLNGINN